jgi:hypothetical protein
MKARLVLAIVATISVPVPAIAAGHGPVFDATTPTLGKGGWSFDQAWMGRLGERPEASDQMLRTMISFGLTEDLQISGSFPIPLRTSTQMNTGRMMAMMSAHREFETLAAWRFHRQTVGEGGRFESTAYVGGAVPLESEHAGMRTAASVYTSVASGYASRSHYFWVGGGYQRYGSDRGVSRATSGRTAWSMGIAPKPCVSTTRSRTCASLSKRSARRPRPRAMEVCQCPAAAATS